MRAPLSAYVTKGGMDATRVHPDTYERLRGMVAPYGWAPMMSEPESGMYRAWLRHPDGRRMFAPRWGQTAEDAVLALVEKVEPLVRQHVAMAVRA